MARLHNIEDHFRNLLYKLYKLWWYPEDYSDKIKEHRIILPIPLDAEQEAILGIIFQQFFFSRHRSIYWGYVIRYDMIQDEIYLCKDTFDHFIPHDARSVIDMVAESIARVGFLDFKTAHTPGAVNAWIDAVVSCAECPAPPKLDVTSMPFPGFPKASIHLPEIPTLGIYFMFLFPSRSFPEHDLGF
ncbi:hypothetical protein PM082_013310 [Marasmius tenuissimus]|nr:hypothetical protein PM082_013310 [Marasmius tenuissimus]